MNTAGHHRAAVGMVALACVSVSAGILISKHVLGAAPVLPFVFLQALGGALFAVPAAVLLRVVPPARALPRLALPGILQPGLTHPLLFAALGFIPLALAGMLGSFETIFVLLLAYPLLRERPTRLQILLAAASVLGFSLLSWSGGSLQGRWLIGVGLVLAADLCASLDTIASRVLTQECHPVALAAATCCSAMAVLAVALFVFPAQSWCAFSSPRPLVITLLSGVLIHALGASLFNAGLKLTTAAEAALLFPSISVLTAVGGFAIYSERLTLLQILGSLVVMVAASAAGVAGGSFAEQGATH